LFYAHNPTKPHNPRNPTPAVGAFQLTAHVGGGLLPASVHGSPITLEDIMRLFQTRYRIHCRVVLLAAVLAIIGVAMPASAAECVFSYQHNYDHHPNGYRGYNVAYPRHSYHRTSGWGTGYRGGAWSTSGGYYFGNTYSPYDYSGYRRYHRSESCHQPRYRSGFDYPKRTYYRRHSFRSSWNCR
jgi:hypothetical protein